MMVYLIIYQMMCMMLCDNVWWCMLCCMMIYDSTRENTCNVLPITLQNVSREIKGKTNNFVHYIWKVLVLEIFLIVLKYIWTYLHWTWWKVFVYKYFLKYLTPCLKISTEIWCHSSCSNNRRVEILGYTKKTS